MSLWPLIGSASGHDRMLRPVSLEAVWPESTIFEKIFENWPVAMLPKMGYATI
jgi:hypothetical protein